MAPPTLAFLRVDARRPLDDATVDLDDPSSRGFVKLEARLHPEFNASDASRREYDVLVSAKSSHLNVMATSFAPGSSITIDGVAVPVANYRGIDADTSPLKMRACFEADGLAGPAAEAPTPLTTPGWFDCFDADGIARDLASGAATAILAATNEPYGFDRIVAAYADGRAFQWRQINRCGEAVFQGDPAPEGWAPPPQGYE